MIWNRRIYLKSIAVLVVIAFVFPCISWAFENTTYPVFPGSIVFKNQTIEIPRELGNVQSTYQSGERLVIHVQDLHCNAEVQGNIARLIEKIARERGLKLVAIEGASLPVNVMHIKTAPERARRNVGRYFVKQGKLSGAEYYAAAGKIPVQLIGIENAVSYEESRKVVGSFLTDEGQGLVYDLREALNEFKTKIYNRELQELDSAKQASREGKMPLLKYAVKLCQLGKRYGIEIKAYINLNQYVGAGVKEYAGINSELLYGELEQLEVEIREQMYTNAAQREMDSLERRLDILERMLNISVTPGELKEYRENPGAFSGERFSEYLKNQDGVDLEEEARGLDEYVGKVKRFYELADERSGIFVENTVKRMNEAGTDLAVLVTGGFHTAAVLAGLRDRKITYISVQPKITHEDLVNPYYSLLRNRKTPLEKLLAENQNILALPPELPQSAVVDRALTAEEMKGQAEQVQVFAKVLDLALGAAALEEGKISEAGIREAFAKAKDTMKYLPIELKTVEVNESGKTALVRLALGKGRDVAVVVRPQGQGVEIGPAFMEVADEESGRESVLLPWSTAAGMERKVLSGRVGWQGSWTAWMVSPAALVAGGATVMLATVAGPRFGPVINQFPGMAEIIPKLRRLNFTGLKKNILDIVEYLSMTKDDFVDRSRKFLGPLSPARTPLSVGFLLSLGLDSRKINRALAWGTKGLYVEIPLIIGTGMLLGAYDLHLWMGAFLVLFALAHQISSWMLNHRVLGWKGTPLINELVGWLYSIWILLPYFLVAEFYHLHNTLPAMFFNSEYTVLASITAWAGAVKMHAPTDFVKFKEMAQFLISKMNDAQDAEKKNVLQNAQASAPNFASRNWHAFLQKLRNTVVEPDPVKAKRLLVMNARGLDAPLAILTERLLVSLEQGNTYEQIENWNALNKIIVAHGFYVGLKTGFELEHVKVIPYFYRIEKVLKNHGVTTLYLQSFPGQIPMDAPRFFFTGPNLIVVQPENFRTEAAREIFPLLGGYAVSDWRSKKYGKTVDLARIFIQQALAQTLTQEEIKSAQELSALLAAREKAAQEYMALVKVKLKASNAGMFVFGEVFSDKLLVWDLDFLPSLRSWSEENGIEIPEALTSLNRQIASRSEAYEAVLEKTTVLLADTLAQQRYLQARVGDDWKSYQLLLSTSPNFGRDLALYLFQTSAPVKTVMKFAVEDYARILAKHLGLIEGKSAISDFSGILEEIFRLEESNPEKLETARQQTALELNLPNLPEIRAPDKTGGDIERNFSNLEKETLLKSDSSLPIQETEKIILGIFAALASKLDVTLVPSMPLQHQADLLKNAVRQHQKFQVNLRLTLNNRQEEWEPLGVYLNAALDMLAAPGFECRLFKAEGQIRAIQGQEKYFLGHGRPGKMALIDAFYDPASALNQHLIQAVFHEMIEAVTPDAGEDAQRARAIHRAIIDQLQTHFFNTQTMRDDLRAYINQQAALSAAPAGLITSTETRAGRLQDIYNFVFNTLLPQLRMDLKNNPVTSEAPVVIDLGVGEGAETTLELRKELNRLNPKVKLIGVDNRQEIIDSMQGTKIRNLSFELGGFNLAPRHQNVDMIFSMNVLRWYSDHDQKMQYLKLMGEALRPGGLLIEGNVASNKGTAGVLIFQKQPGGELIPIRLMVRYNYPNPLELPTTLNPQLVLRVRSEFGKARMETSQEFSGPVSAISLPSLINNVIKILNKNGYSGVTEDPQSVWVAITPDGKSLVRSSSWGNIDSWPALGWGVILAAPFLVHWIYTWATGQPLPWLDHPTIRLLLPTSLPLVFSAILGWFARAAGKRAGPFAPCAFLESAQTNDPSVLFFKVKNTQLIVNPRVKNILIHLPTRGQSVLLYALGIIGHESWHLRGHEGWGSELVAYGVMQGLPALLGAFLFGGIALGAGITAGWIIFSIGLIGAALSTGLWGLAISPVAGKRAEVQQKQSLFYSKLVNPGASISAGYNQPALLKLLNQLPIQPERPLRILDLGSGMGYNLKTLHEQYPNARIVSSDFNPKILEISKSLKSKRAIEDQRKFLKENGFWDNVIDDLVKSRPETEELWEKQIDFVEGDAQNFKSPGGEYDLVICTEVLEHVGNPEQAMREIQRLLKPGGYAVVSTPNYAWNFAGLLKGFFDWKAGIHYWDPWGAHHKRGEFGRENYMTAGRLEEGLKSTGLKITQTLGLNYWLSWLTPIMVYVLIKFWPTPAYGLQDRYPGFFINRIFVPLKKTAMSYFVVTQKEKKSTPEKVPNSLSTAPQLEISTRAVKPSLDHLSPREFKEMIAEGYRTGAIQYQSDYDNWDKLDPMTLKAGEKKLISAGTFVLRKIGGRWCLLLGQRSPEKASDKPGFFSAPVGKVDKPIDFQLRETNAGRIEQLKKSGIIKQQDEDPLGKRETILEAAERETREEAGIPAEALGRINYLRGNHQGILVNFFVHVDETNDPHVAGNGELINYQWIPLEEILAYPPEILGKKIEGELQRRVPGSSLMDGLKTAGLKNLRLFLVQALTPMETAPSTLPDAKTFNTELDQVNRFLDAEPAGRHIAVFYGGARMQPGNPIYKVVEDLAEYLAGMPGKEGFSIRSGGGPGAMTAAMDGAAKVNPGKRGTLTAIKLKLRGLPFADILNHNVERSIEVDHTQVRKAAMEHQVNLSIFAPGGFGTFDELFEALSHGVPVLLLDKSYWNPIMQTLKMTLQEHGFWQENLFDQKCIVDTAEEALHYISSRNYETNATTINLDRNTVAIIKAETITALAGMKDWPESVVVIGGEKAEEKLDREVLGTAQALNANHIPICAGSLDAFQLLDPVVDNLRRISPQPASGQTAIQENKDRIILADNGLVHRFLLSQKAQAYVFLPGDIHKLNILFDLLTQIQTKKLSPRPVILVGRKFWEPIMGVLTQQPLSQTPPLITSAYLSFFKIVDSEAELLDALEPAVGKLTKKVPGTLSGTSDKVEIDRKEITIHRAGKTYSFGYIPIVQSQFGGFGLNYYGVGGLHDDEGEVPDIFVYFQNDYLSTSPPSLRGMMIKDIGLRGQALMSPVLNLFFNRFPEIRRTRNEMRDLLLLYIIAVQISRTEIGLV
jgi:predicted Rossmann-fold nucleotide-binding protein/2-polyprenyl-3-methyl-5-hydroxy-6-metoxy-1,4-benzoquinol methylase/8-oxo-dGTP pyrophosphatase MutT (NUDIX family)